MAMMLWANWTAHIIHIYYNLSGSDDDRKVTGQLTIITFLNPKETIIRWNSRFNLSFNIRVLYIIRCVYVGKFMICEII